MAGLEDRPGAALKAFVARTLSEREAVVILMARYLRDEPGLVRTILLDLLGQLDLAQGRLSGPERRENGDLDAALDPPLTKEPDHEP